MTHPQGQLGIKQLDASFSRTVKETGIFYCRKIRQTLVIRLGQIYLLIFHRGIFAFLANVTVTISALSSPMWPMLELPRPGRDLDRPWLIMLLHGYRPPNSNPILMHQVLKRSYSNPRKWTETSLQVRLMQESVYLLFNDIPPHKSPLQARSSPIR